MIKEFCTNLATLLGLWRLTRLVNKKSLTIVLYHGVAPQTEQGIYRGLGKFITPEAFETHLSFLKKFYHVMDLDTAVENLATGTLPDYSLAITFDDGYENYYTHALPILKKYNLSATFFVTSDFVLKGIPLWVDRVRYALKGFPIDKIERGLSPGSLKKLPDEKRMEIVRYIEGASSSPLLDFSGERRTYAPLSITQIKEMMALNMRFGCHTASHPILSTVSGPRLDFEVKDSFAELSRTIGRLSSSFAYPNGQPEDMNEATDACIKKSGFTSALTTIEGTNEAGSNLFKLNRITLDGLENKREFIWAVSGLRYMARKILRGKS